MQKTVHEIKENGFSVIKGLFDQSEVEEFKDDLQNLLEHSPEFLHQSASNKFIYNLQNKNLNFYTKLVRKKPIKEILKECLNDTFYKHLPNNKANFIMRGLVARNSGAKSLKMHIDSFVPSPGDFIWNMIISIPLYESTDENGATRLVPKSHRSGQWAPSVENEEYVTQCASPGDAVIWDGRIWHGAGPNRSGEPRWTINGTFSRWWIKQSYDLPNAFPKGLLGELSDEEMSILGFCNLPPTDEFNRINIQGGYELLKSFSPK